MPGGGELALESFGAWRRGDREWAIAHSSPDIVIQQPVGLPDARSYRGHQGIRDALDDWPQQWEAFDISDVDVVDESGDVAILFTRHHLRARGGLEFELDVWNVFAYEDGCTRSWDMFMTLDEARARFDALTTR
jgi:ketosteroid isomerase-like protein